MKLFQIDPKCKLILIILFLCVPLLFFQIWVPAYIFIGVIPICVYYNFINKKFIPLIIFLIAFCLLLSRSLTPFFLNGMDIQYEYFSASRVLATNAWNINNSDQMNPLINLVIGAPIYSNVIGFDLKYCFSFIFPFIFALVPMVVYIIVEKQTNYKIAFLSCFFFISGFTFYGEMLQITRQQIAEFFFILLIMILISDTNKKNVKAVLVIFLAISITLSHYSIAYFLVYFLLVSEILKFMLINTSIFPAIKERITYCNQTIDTLKVRDLLNFKIIFIIVIFIILWQGIGDSHNFQVIVNMGQKISDHITSDLLSSSSQDAGVQTFFGVRELSTMSKTLLKYFYYITTAFICLGFMTFFITYKKYKFNDRYIIISFLSIPIIISCIILPFFASALNMTRIYHILLLIISPFCILGGIFFFSFIQKMSCRDKLSDKNKDNLTENRSILILTVILICYFFLNMGIFSNLIDSQFQSQKNPNQQITSMRPSYIINERDLYTQQWIKNSTDDPIILTGNVGKYNLIHNYPPIGDILVFSSSDVTRQKYSLIFTTLENYNTGNIDIPKSTAGSDTQLLPISTLLYNDTKIYTNPASIYL